MRGRCASHAAAKWCARSSRRDAGHATWCVKAVRPLRFAFSQHAGGPAVGGRPPSVFAAQQAAGRRIRGSSLPERVLWLPRGQPAAATAAAELRLLHSCASPGLVAWAKAACSVHAAGGMKGSEVQAYDARGGMCSVSNTGPSEWKAATQNAQQNPHCAPESPPGWQTWW